MSDKGDSAKNLSKKMAELDKLVEYFEQEDFDIDEGIKKYEQGMKLANEVKEMLKSYELKINEIREKYSN